MSSIKVIRRDTRLTNPDYLKEGNKFALQFSKPGLEVVRYYFQQEEHGNFIPPEDPDTVESYLVLNGCMTVTVPDGESSKIDPGEMLVLTSGFPTMRFHTIPETEIIYTTTKSTYQTMHDTVDLTTKIMEQVEQHDGYTRRHCQRVKFYSLEIARILNYPAEDLLDLSIAANLHDVGKLKIPKDILTKAGRLTTEEYELIKTHSTATLEILSPLVGDKIAFLAASHHERPDGNGYPLGLIDSGIPFASKIIAVADAYDAMISQRGYNQVKSRTEAVVELNRFAGTQFDRTCVNALCEFLVSQTHIQSNPHR